ncbi:XtrA/YqaO family protein [Peribacillus frigoritolerans]|uniref:XtrA/YqaO family protein n=1 Tax=Peribacillus frigoritolerans TaxID=450367 RepID=UPI00399D01B9
MNEAARLSNENTIRLQNIDIDPHTVRMEVNIMEMHDPCVIVICNGKVKLRVLPPFGEYKITTHQGKVKRMRKEEGEEF